MAVIGEKTKEEKLFYYLRAEDLIPQDHILRLINHYVDFSFIRTKVEHLYSHTGRPSVDPDVMMRMLLVGYLFGITSERRLCDEVGMHLGYRWFVGLALEDKVPDHSTFSKNRHGRFKESGIYGQIFDHIVLQCVEKGLVSGKHLTVDSKYLGQSKRLLQKPRTNCGVTQARAVHRQDRERKSRGRGTRRPRGTLGAPRRFSP